MEESYRIENRKYEGRKKADVRVSEQGTWNNTRRTKVTELRKQKLEGMKAYRHTSKLTEDSKGKGEGKTKVAGLRESKNGLG